MFESYKKDPRKGVQLISGYFQTLSGINDNRRQIVELLQVRNGRIVVHGDFPERIAAFDGIALCRFLVYDCFGFFDYQRLSDVNRVGRQAVPSFDGVHRRFVFLR